MAAILVEKKLQEADFRKDEALAFPPIRSFRQRMLLFSPQEDTASCRILWAKTTPTYSCANMEGMSYVESHCNEHS